MPDKKRGTAVWLVKLDGARIIVEAVGQTLTDRIFTETKT